MTAQNDDLFELAVRLNVTIRKARRDDVAKLEWHGQFSHFRHQFRRAYREQLAGRRLMLVADSNDFPVARLFILFKSRNAAMADGVNRAYFYSFHVMDVLRGKGIGTRLLDVGEMLLQRRGYKTATIAVARENKRALQLYLRRGYHNIGEEDGQWRYYDHRGQLQHVHEPAYLLSKSLELR